MSPLLRGPSTTKSDRLNHYRYFYETVKPDTAKKYREDYVKAYKEGQNGNYQKALQLFKKLKENEELKTNPIIEYNIQVCKANL